MSKLGLKAGAKLDLTARIGDEEMDLKSSFFKESGGKLQLTTPMAGGKSWTLPEGTPVALSWTVDGTHFSLDGTASGSVKQGIRTYLLVTPKDEVQRSERRAFVRVPAEIDVEIINGDTTSDGSRVMRTYTGRTSDISNGGVAVYTDAPMVVGETVDVVILQKGKRMPLRAAVCWLRPAPRTAGFRSSVGLQFFFLNSEEAMGVAKLTASLAAKR